MKAGATQPHFGIIFFIIQLIITGNSMILAQNEVDVLYLHNGNVIRGYLVDQPDSSVVRIETLCHNIFQFQTIEISGIRKELLQKRKNRPFTPKLTGYENITDFGLLIASGHNQKNAIFSILSTHNYSFKNGMAPGAGIGLEFFEQLVIPLYASLNWQIYTKKFTPFVTIKTGYSFAPDDPVNYWDYSVDATGGMMWSAGVGTKIWRSHRNAFVISILYRYQRIHSVRTWEWTDNTTSLLKKYNRLEIRFGFQF